MTSVATFLNELRALLGLGEYPPGSNRNKVSEWYGMIGPWCAMTVSYALAHARYTLFHYAYCPTIEAEAQRGVNGMQWLPRSADILPGDSLLWSWHQNGVADHISVAELASVGGGNIATIGGNENDRCQRTVRNRACLLGIVRLPLDRSGQHASPPPVRSGGSLQVDGGFGVQTIAALQRAVGVADDGDFGPISRRALQAHLGVDQDGVIGPVTIEALQRKVWAAVDGDWGPQTTSKLQEALNAGRF